MVYRFQLTNSAEKDLASLPHSIAQRILTKLKSFSAIENPLLLAKKLKGFDHPTFRYRVGDYRIVFRLDSSAYAVVILVVLRIAHRKEVYKHLN